MAGAAVLAIGIAGAASAQTANVMTVALPGGGVAEIRYTGNVPPKVVIGETPPAYAALTPAASFFGLESPFAMMERISAEMDREAAAMFRRAELLAAQARSGQPIEAAFGSLPSGSRGYTFISTASGNGVCTRSVEITSQRGGPPRVVSRSTGNCDPATGGSDGAATVPAVPARPAKQPDLLLTRNGGSQLVWSAEFLGQLPWSAGLHPSAFGWLNAKGALGMLSTVTSNPAIGTLLAGHDPILVVFDGTPERIHAASRTRISGLIMDAMLIENLSRATLH